MILNRHTNEKAFVKEMKDTMNVVSFTIAYPQQYVVLYSNQDTVFLAYSMPNAHDLFNSLKLLQINRDVRYMLTRLVVQPSARITSSILTMLNTYKDDLKRCVTLQIRMGGEEAAFQERAQFLKVKSIKKQMKLLNVYLKKNETMYITSDSYKILASTGYFFTNHKVVTSKDFKITHSGDINKEYKEGMKRAIADAVVASHCNTIYITPWSSYGELIQYMSFYKSVRSVNVFKIRLFILNRRLCGFPFYCSSFLFSNCEFLMFVGWQTSP